MEEFTKLRLTLGKRRVGYLYRGETQSLGVGTDFNFSQFFRNFDIKLLCISIPTEGTVVSLFYFD
jgi:hypothetical protein